MKRSDRTTATELTKLRTYLVSVGFDLQTAASVIGTQARNRSAGDVAVELRLHLKTLSKKP